MSWPKLHERRSRNETGTGGKPFLNGESWVLCPLRPRDDPSIYADGIERWQRNIRLHPSRRKRTPKRNLPPLNKSDNDQSNRDHHQSPRRATAKNIWGNGSHMAPWLQECIWNGRLWQSTPTPERMGPQDRTCGKHMTMGWHSNHPPLKQRI